MNSAERHFWEHRTPHMVYEFFNRHGEALYVGCTSNIVRRLEQHSRKEWWSQVATIHTTTHLGQIHARAAESLRIAELEPLWNTYGVAEPFAPERTRKRKESLDPARLAFWREVIEERRARERAEA